MHLSLAVKNVFKVLLSFRFSLHFNLVPLMYSNPMISLCCLTGLSMASRFNKSMRYHSDYE